MITWKDAGRAMDKIMLLIHLILCPRQSTKSLHSSIQLLFITIPWGGYSSHLPHFTAEETEAHRTEVICPRSSVKSMVGLGFECRPSSSAPKYNKYFNMFICRWASKQSPTCGRFGWKFYLYLVSKFIF